MCEFQLQSIGEWALIFNNENALPAADFRGFARRFFLSWHNVYV